MTTSTGAPVPVGRCRGRWRRAGSALVTVLLLALAWPSTLGGALTLVAVAGHSMEPTYRTGDLLIVYPRRQYRPGQVIVYRVPAGEAGAGARVVHRIVSVDAEGRFTTRGDNRRSVDAWHPQRGDVDGSPVLHLPLGARFVVVLRQPLPLAAATGLLVFVAIALPDRRPRTEVVPTPT